MSDKNRHEAQAVVVQGEHDIFGIAWVYHHGDLIIVDQPEVIIFESWYCKNAERFVGGHCGPKINEVACLYGKYLPQVLPICYIFLNLCRQLKQMDAQTHRIIAPGAWLTTPGGLYVRAWEEARLAELTADIFGFNALQIGLPQIDTLAANRMPHKFYSDCHSPTSTHQPQVQVQVLHDLDELPFASQSLDLVVLPHVLEFAHEPHQILREVERILMPEGQLIICGFNPASLWGMRRVLGRLGGAQFLQREGELISMLRLKDWLKLLNLHATQAHFGCYVPPFSSAGWLQRWSFMEKVGDRWWPYLGAVYILQAKKRVKGMRLIGPAWSNSKLAIGGVTVSNTLTSEHQHEY